MDFVTIDGSDVDIDRYWSKVDRRGPDECWEWLCSRQSGGHGRFSIKSVYRSAHRVAYALEHGVCDVPLIRHLCGNAACVNPAHLAPGTPTENMRDRRVHGTASRGTLSEEQVEDIIELLMAGFKHDTIAAAYGCSRMLVAKIATGETWDWIRPDVDRSTLRRQKPHTPVTDGMRTKILELSSSGLIQKDVASRLGVHQTTVSRILREYRHEEKKQAKKGRQ